MEVGPSLWEGALSSRPWKDPPTQVHPGQVILEEQSEEASQRRCYGKGPVSSRSQGRGRSKPAGGCRGWGEGGSKKMGGCAMRGRRETPERGLCHLQLPGGPHATRNSPERLSQHSLGMATCGCPALDSRMSRVPTRTCDTQKRESVPNPGQA